MSLSKPALLPAAVPFIVIPAKARIHEHRCDRLLAGMGHGSPTFAGMKVENGEALRATISRFGLIRLAQLVQLLEQHVAVQLRQMVYEQHSVKMVQFVLEEGGEQALKLLVLRETAIDIGNANSRER